MYPAKKWYKFLTLLLLAGIVIGFTGAQNASATTAGNRTAQTRLAPQVSYPVHQDVSPALRSVQVAAAALRGRR